MQTSVVHTLLSSQLMGVWPTHLPLSHASGPRQALPSSHAPPTGVLAQPTAGSQPSSVHTLPSAQLTASPETQPPFRHTSFAVQALPSVQGTAVVGVLAQPALWSQASTVQGLLSSQPEMLAMHVANWQ